VAPVRHDPDIGGLPDGCGLIRRDQVWALFYPFGCAFAGSCKIIIDKPIPDSAFLSSCALYDRRRKASINAA
jgi:hypothetical protein